MCGHQLDAGRRQRRRGRRLGTERRRCRAAPAAQ